MLTKKEDIICPFCNKVTGTKKHKKKIEIDEHKKLYWAICDECSELMKECVTLRCLGVAWEIERDWKVEQVPCCSVTMVTKEALEKNGFVEGVDFELGWYWDIYGCPSCSVDKKFHFKK